MLGNIVFEFLFCFASFEPKIQYCVNSCVEFVGEEDDQSPNNGNSASLHWTYPMERYFLDLLLEQVHMGNKIGHKFNDRAWSWMIASFNEKFGLQCDKGVLEELYFSLMEEYNNITDFLSRNGFVWDDIQQTVVADDDVWESYIQVHFFLNPW